MLRHWALTFLGNLAGALFIVGIIIGHSGVLSSDALKNEVFAIATAKAVTPAWYQIFLKAIGANWLVCLACFLACCAREFFSKVVAIWWPVFAFVLLGLDHVIANMFYSTSPPPSLPSLTKLKPQFPWPSSSATPPSPSASTSGNP